MTFGTVGWNYLFETIIMLKLMFGWDVGMVEGVYSACSNFGDLVLCGNGNYGIKKRVYIMT